MSFMELDLNIRMSENPLALNKSDAGEDIVVVREYAGNIENFQKPQGVDYFFVIVDAHNGQSFMGDIHYREQLLKLTPKVQLQLIKRKQLTKEIEYTPKGEIKKKIYL